MAEKNRRIDLAMSALGAAHYESEDKALEAIGAAYQVLSNGDGSRAVAIDADRRANDARLDAEDLREAMRADRTVEAELAEGTK